MREATWVSSRHYPALDDWNRTIDGVLDEAVAADPTGLYVSDGEHRIDRRALSTAAARVRRVLAGAGVLRGDVVSMQLANSWQTVAAMHAAWSLGAVVNPITTIYRESELATIFRLAEPVAVVVSSSGRGADFVSMAHDAAAAAGIEIAMIDLDGILTTAVETSAAVGEFRPARPGSGEPTDVALVMFTSGTTGTPKGVLHSHRTLLYEAASIVQTFDLEGQSVFMPSPLAHITGLLYGVLMPLLAEGSVSLLDKWDPSGAADVIERDGCTFTVAATPFLRGLADEYSRRRSVSSLQAFVCGGADIPPVLVVEAERAMAMRVVRTYGSTEMPTLCIVRPDDTDDARLSSEGYAIGEAEARLSDDGELEVRGPELFVGYADTADNKPAFTDDGWFRTGDLADITPDGRVTITGRRKDLIVRGGENISAKEIEDLLLAHPAISDVAVIGIPDEVMGERACAVVVVEPGTQLNLADVTVHLDGHSIARQKYPERLWRVDSFPRTASGKVQKFVLRAQATKADQNGELESRA